MVTMLPATGGTITLRAQAVLNEVVEDTRIRDRVRIFEVEAVAGARNCSLVSKRAEVSGR